MRAEHNAGAEVGLWLMTHHQRRAQSTVQERRAPGHNFTKFQFKLNFNLKFVELKVSSAYKTRSSTRARAQNREWQPPKHPP
jgi:hypothetical protein